MSHSLLRRLPFRHPTNCQSRSAEDMPESILGYAIVMGGRHQLFISVISVAIAVISVAPIALQRDIVNEAIEGGDLDLLVWLCLVFLGVIVLRLLLKYCLGIYQNWIGESVIRCEREHLSDAFARERDPRAAMGDEDADAVSNGQAVSVINNEVDIVGRFVGTGISDIVADGGKLIFGIGYMIFVEPLLALVAAAFILPQVLIVPFLQRVLNRLIRERTDQLRDLSDAVASMEEGENEIDDAYRDRLDAIFTNRISAAYVKFAIKQLVNFLNALAPLSVLAFGGYLYIQDATSIGTIVAFTTGFDRIAGPLRAMVNYYRLASVRNEQYEKIRNWKRALSC